MSDIGLRLFQQLKSMNAQANKDDYFSDEQRSWNVRALEEHLLMAQQKSSPSGMPQQQQQYAHSQPPPPQPPLTHSQLAQSSSRSQPPATSFTHLNGNHVTVGKSDALPRMPSSSSSFPCDVNVTVTPTLHDLPLITMSNGHFNPDVSSMPAMQPMPVLMPIMPSPNGSPSIDYDETAVADVAHDANGNNGSTTSTTNGHGATLHSHLNCHSTANGDSHVASSSSQKTAEAVVSTMRKKKSTKSKSKSPATKKSNKNGGATKKSNKNGGGNRKRKASSADVYDPRNMDISSASSSVSHDQATTATAQQQPPPPPKKQRKSTGKIVRKNEWNASALKKLYSLKRAVVNSAWFWEPVDEQKHTAPNYHLVCPCPSDYGTICTRLERFEYAHLDVFLRDCELVFINARMYNTSTHHVHAASLKLEKKFKE
eukprot:CAMPEP_0202730680 /NCGR_PEP_ID=MMETSP1385-20130828/186763_1 /ASSEMBLY_ACC=CAM_ASM_000861 /TAXON_ID=933848 /ORGANISM="Elphidium margaritaceum" /LENGTH=426 /DNA_ID=CAMNT_0049396959 /DNA_START=80 /DNA_END=1357 /DNA_ORIENTATION=-